MRGHNEKSIRLARRLRVDQTDAETVLWNRIRNRSKVLRFWNNDVLGNIEGVLTVIQIELAAGEV